MDLSEVFRMHKPYGWCGFWILMKNNLVFGDLMRELHYEWTHYLIHSMHVEMSNSQASLIG